MERELRIGLSLALRRVEPSTGTYPESSHIQGDVLVESERREGISDGCIESNGGDSRIEDEFAQTLITPSPVDEQQLLEEPELTDGDVGRSSSLESLDSRDSDSDVSCLDHAHVVCAVSDSEEDRVEVLLDELDDEGLLER